jgi:hypothetical protein
LTAHTNIQFGASEPIRIGGLDGALANRNTALQQEGTDLIDNRGALSHETLADAMPSARDGQPAWSRSRRQWVTTMKSVYSSVSSPRP